MIGIYAIRQVGTDKVYVGSSSRVERRFYEHRRSLAKGAHTSQYLQHAWDKHGAEAFVFEVLKTCSREELIPQEQQLLLSLNTCFNMSKLAAGGTRKEDWSTVRREVLAGSMRGNSNGRTPRSAETCAKIQAIKKADPPRSMLGKHHTPETIERIRATNKANKTRRHVGMLGKKHSGETKEKCRVASSGKKQSPETIEKRRASLAAFRAAQPPEWFAEYGRKISATKRSNNRRGPFRFW